MKINKNAESIVWIIVAVTILSFAMLWIVNVLTYNRDIKSGYSKKVDKLVLQTNADNIAEKLDLSLINNNETFYIYKDETNKKYKVFTWSQSENYKFIDKFWNYLTNFEWDVYTREFIKTTNTWLWSDGNIDTIYNSVKTIIEKYN
jgi:hypothetical protein